MTAAGQRLAPRPGPLKHLRIGLPAAMVALGPPWLRRFWFWLAVLAICGGSGAFYGAISAYGRPWIGAVYGLFTGGTVMVFEQGLVLPSLRHKLRSLPWLVGVLLTEVVYLVLVLVGTAIAGTALWLPGLIGGAYRDAVVIGPITVLYALMVSGILITMIRMRDLIGADVFRHVLFGRYYRPVEEERIFLFIDLIGSTAYAQAHGDLRAQAFLGAIFAALAEPVRRHGGTIDDYVGDMALVTWPMDVGLPQARCLACILAFIDAIEREGDAWRRDFGQVPQFRAALHGGSIVTAEVGIDRRKISYFGDVVNTTGRIEKLCRVLDRSVLVSADLYDRLEEMPAGLCARHLGAHALKGRGLMLDVLAIERADAASAEMAA